MIDPLYSLSGFGVGLLVGMMGIGADRITACCARAASGHAAAPPT